MQPTTITPEQLGVLDTERAARPDDANLITRSGVAHYRAGNFLTARDILAASLALDPEQFEARLHLGLAQEKLGDLRGAREAYQAAGALGGSRGQRGEVEARLNVLDRLELAAEARDAVARERLQDTPALTDRAIAVLPFQYLGHDEALRPLGRGLTHLVISDLSKIGRLTLLERERVQAIADELELVAQGQVAGDLAARSGRILGASRVVQGSVRELTTGNGIQIAANVVTTADGTIGASGVGEDRLQRLFDLEKTLVLDLLGQLGIVPTPAERRAIEERPTADLQAFLSFSRGLEAEDRGDFGSASRWFASAVLMDGGYGDARGRVAETQRLAAAVRIGADRMIAASQARAQSLGRAVSLVSPSTASVLEQRSGEQTRTRSRAQVQEGLNRDDPTLIGLIGTILLVVPRP
ncbi:MAG: CsgG/HfaB family protein [Gemmatimonadota bacterium]|nr:CsgG/HfaB family protein [Gemmatimonadota bacterium]